MNVARCSRNCLSTTVIYQLWKTSNIQRLNQEGYLIITIVNSKNMNVQTDC